jgi:hypothetical protein
MMKTQIVLAAALATFTASPLSAQTVVDKNLKTIGAFEPDDGVRLKTATGMLASLQGVSRYGFMEAVSVDMYLYAAPNCTGDAYASLADGFLSQPANVFGLLQNAANAFYYRVRIEYPSKSNVVNSLSAQSVNRYNYGTKAWECTNETPPSSPAGKVTRQELQFTPPFALK